MFRRCRVGFIPLTTGFTLIELLVVVAIIGILVGLLFPAFSHARQVAKKTRAKAEVKQLDIAFRAIQSDYRGFTTTPSAVNLATKLDIDGEEIDGNVVGFLQGVNSRGTVYMEFDNTSTNGAGAFVDPWNGVYRAALGSGGTITPPHGTIYRQIGAWSKGRDQLDDTAERQKDDVTSW